MIKIRKYGSEYAPKLLARHLANSESQFLNNYSLPVLPTGTKQRL